MATYKQNAVRISTEAVDRSLTGIAAAWNSYEGDSNTILGSLNVSSITDVSTAIHTTNLTNSMDSAVFCLKGLATQDTDTTALGITGADNKAAGSVQVSTKWSSNQGLIDAAGWVDLEFTGDLA